MNEAFEKWFGSLTQDELSHRSLHENMLHAWHMSRMLLPASDPNAKLEHLLTVAKKALDEMCNVGAPNSHFTDVVDELDAAITEAEKQ